MQKDYTSYTVSDFLQDDSFLVWRIFPQEEDNLFWENFIKEHPQKADEINRAIKILQSVDLNAYSLVSREKECLFKDIFESIEKKKKKRIVRTILSTAVSLALLLACSYFIIHKIAESGGDFVEVIDENIHNDKAVRLIFADNKTMAFEENASIQYENGNLIVFSGTSKIVSAIDTKTVGMNRLIVPKGKRSSLTLYDGTKIWINSGTTLEYPTTFKSSKREIRVDGEIYIEVTKKEKQPFFVNTSFLDVKVLGTRFNVSAYKEDTEHTVALVEGRVEVEAGSGKTQMLQPDQLLTIAQGIFQVKKVNVYDYISWKDGLLQFRSEPLGHILSRLSRCYDVQIECDPDIRDMRCTGKLILFNNFDSVLQTISNTIPVKCIKDGNKVMIKK